MQTTETPRCPLSQDPHGSAPCCRLERPSRLHGSSNNTAVCATLALSYLCHTNIAAGKLAAGSRDAHPNAEF
eukprot:3985465-Amphidinium_carterae.1